MVRRCKHRPCTTELPPARQCTDIIQKRGFCSVECLTLHSREKLKRKSENEAKAERGEVRRKKARDNHNNKPHQTELTQKAFNQMIRLLDDGLPCISCGRHQCGTYWDAGHFLTVAAHPELRFDPRACHRQGSACNRANRRPDKNNSRNAETIAQEYESRLRERHGNEMVDWIKGPHEIPHWSCDDLRALRKVFAAECRRLERGEEPSRDWRAMDYEVQDLI